MTPKSDVRTFFIWFCVVRLDGVNRSQTMGYASPIPEENSLYSSDVFSDCERRSSHPDPFLGSLHLSPDPPPFPTLLGFLISLFPSVSTSPGVRYWAGVDRASSASSNLSIFPPPTLLFFLISLECHLVPPRSPQPQREIALACSLQLPHPHPARLFPIRLPRKSVPPPSPHPLLVVSPPSAASPPLADCTGGFLFTFPHSAGGTPPTVVPPPPNVPT